MRYATGMRNLHVMLGACAIALVAGCSSNSAQTTDEKFSSWLAVQAPEQVNVIETRCAQEGSQPEETCYMVVELSFHGDVPARGEFYCKIPREGDFAPECPGVGWLAQDTSRAALASLLLPDPTAVEPDTCAGTEGVDALFCMHTGAPA